jgi:hypothetical protein
MLAEPKGKRGRADAAWPDPASPALVVRARARAAVGGGLDPPHTAGRCHFDEPVAHVACRPWRSGARGAAIVSCTRRPACGRACELRGRAGQGRRQLRPEQLRAAALARRQWCARPAAWPRAAPCRLPGAPMRSLGTTPPGSSRAKQEQARAARGRPAMPALRLRLSARARAQARRCGCRRRRRTRASRCRRCRTRAPPRAAWRPRSPLGCRHRCPRAHRHASRQPTRGWGTLCWGASPSVSVSGDADACYCAAWARSRRGRPASRALRRPYPPLTRAPRAGARRGRLPQPVPELRRLGRRHAARRQRRAGRRQQRRQRWRQQPGDRRPRRGQPGQRQPPGRPRRRRRPARPGRRRRRRRPERPGRPGAGRLWPGRWRPGRGLRSGRVRRRGARGQRRSAGQAAAGL